MRKLERRGRKEGKTKEGKEGSGSWEYQTTGGDDRAWERKKGASQLD